MRDAGFKQLTVWVTPEQEVRIRAMLAKAKPKARNCP